MERTPIIFSLSANKELTKKVCEKFNTKPSPVIIQKFADNEVLTYSQVSVRGQDVFVIQSTSNPANEHIMELLIFIDSLKRASAKSINVITPYFGYGRQDRKNLGRQPISSKLMADLLTTAGASRLITFDFHASQIQGFFNIPVDNLKASIILGQRIKKLKLDNLVFAAGDFGGVEYARELSDMLGNNSPIVGIDKIRTGPNESEISHVYGDVRDKNVVIIDDIVDTGGTVLHAAESFLKKGANKVYLAIVHPVFSNNSFVKLEKFSFEKIFITDTIPFSGNSKKLEIISVSDFLFEVIKSILENKSVSNVYKKYGRF